jgi:hypothetical protein
MKNGVRRDVLKYLILWWPLEDSNLQPKDYENKCWTVRQSAMECNSVKPLQNTATGQCEDYGHFTLVSA